MYQTLGCLPLMKGISPTELVERDEVTNSEPGLCLAKRFARSSLHPTFVLKHILVQSSALLSAHNWL
jgi:hypothetical protein